MKRISMIIAAMFAMAQINAATTDAATTSVSTTVQTAVADNDDNDSNWEISHPFKNDDDSTKHWSFETNGIYFGMGIKHNWEPINNSFEVGLLNALSFRYNSLHGQIVSLGIGVNHRSYSIKRPNMLVRDNAGVVELSTYPSNNVDEIKDRSSNLNIWEIQFPLMFRQKIAGKLEIGVAGIMNWNTAARVDNHYEMDKTDFDIHFKGLKQKKMNFDFMGTLTWNGLGLYCRYSPSKLFKDGFGPEIKETWTMGIMLDL